MAAAPTATARTAAPAPVQATLLADALAEVAALDRQREQAEQAAEQAATAVQQARIRHRSAQAAADRAEAELSSARTALRTARDPLVELGAPSVDGAGLADGWAVLTQWAGEQASARSAALGQAREEEAAATALRDQARRRVRRRGTGSGRAAHRREDRVRG